MKNNNNKTENQYRAAYILVTDANLSSVLADLASLNFSDLGERAHAMSHAMPYIRLKFRAPKRGGLTRSEWLQLQLSIDASGVQPL